MQFSRDSLLTNSFAATLITVAFCVHTLFFVAALCALTRANQCNATSACAREASNAARAPYVNIRALWFLTAFKSLYIVESAPRPAPSSEPPNSPSALTAEEGDHSFQNQNAFRPHSSGFRSRRPQPQKHLVISKEKKKGQSLGRSVCLLVRLRPFAANSSQTWLLGCKLRWERESGAVGPRDFPLCQISEEQRQRAFCPLVSSRACPY
jgi:hypothetical protein